jgi:hypothetical protein
MPLSITGSQCGPSERVSAERHHVDGQEANDSSDMASVHRELASIRSVPHVTNRLQPSMQMLLEWCFERWVRALLQMGCMPGSTVSGGMAK